MSSELPKVLLMNFYKLLEIIYFGKFSTISLLDAFIQVLQKTVYNYSVVAPLAKKLRVVAKKNFL